jgi:hypothetical protein
MHSIANIILLGTSCLTLVVGTSSQPMVEKDSILYGAPIFKKDGAIIPTYEPYASSTSVHSIVKATHTHHPESTHLSGYLTHPTHSVDHTVSHTHHSPCHSAKTIHHHTTDTAHPSTTYSLSATPLPDVVVLFFPERSVQMRLPPQMVSSTGSPRLQPIRRAE